MSEFAESMDAESGAESPAFAAPEKGLRSAMGWAEQPVPAQSWGSGENIAPDMEQSAQVLSHWADGAGTSKQHSRAPATPSEEPACPAPRSEEQNGWDGQHGTAGSWHSVGELWGPLDTTQSAPGQKPAQAKPQAGTQQKERHSGSKKPGKSDAAVLERISQYDAFIHEASQKFDIPVAQIKAVIATESKGVPTASSGAAFGLMQITKGTWETVRNAHPDLKQYAFKDWTDPHINILFGTATLKDKTRLIGVNGQDPHFAELAITAYNAGEGTVKYAIRNARRGGSKNPTADCMKPEFLKPAIRETKIYTYYLTGKGKRQNPHAAVPTSAEAIETAVDLKYLEVSRYPGTVKHYLAAQSGEDSGPPPGSEPADTHEPPAQEPPAHKEQRHAKGSRSGGAAGAAHGLAPAGSGSGETPPASSNSAGLAELLSKKHLSAEELAQARSLIEKEPETQRSALYLELQEKVEYVNQRDNESEEKGKLIGDRMCNLSSLAMCLQYLGIANPHPEMQYEDALERVRRDRHLKARTTAEGWGGVAKALGATVHFIKAPVAGILTSAFWHQVQAQQLAGGAAVMLSITDHIVRLQGVHEEGLIVDDPFGKSKLLPGRKHTWKGRNRSPTKEPDAAANAGEDHVWPWEDVEQHSFLWVASFSR